MWARELGGKQSSMVPRVKSEKCLHTEVMAGLYGRTGRTLNHLAGRRPDDTDFISKSSY